MAHPDVTCICCNRTLPYHMYAARNQICNPCTLLSPNDIALTTRLNVERQYTIRAETTAGRRESRQLAKLAKYAITGKRCSAGWHYLLPSAFGVCQTRGDGLQANCKSCNKLRVSIINTGGSTSMWHTIRDAIRASATGPLNMAEQK